MNFDAKWLLIAALVTACVTLAWLLIKSRLHRNSSGTNADGEADAQQSAIVVDGGQSPEMEGTDDQLVEVIPIEIGTRTSVIEVSASVRTLLQNVIQRAPAMTSAGKQIFDRGVRLNFSKAVTQSLHSGDAVLVKNAAGNVVATARDVRTGKFVGNAKTLAQGGSKALQVTTMAWQLASIATAQHYLGEINAKLQSIEDGIKDVLFMLEQENRSAITEGIWHLRQYHNELRRGKLAKEEFPVIRQRIEQIEAECFKIADIGRTTLDEKRRELEQIEIREWFGGREATARRAATLIDATSKAMHLVFMAHACRVMACQVRAALPNGHAFVNERLEHAKTEVQQTAQLLQEAKEDFLKRLDGLKVRQDNPLALWGKFDGDHHRAVSEAYQIAEHQARATRDMLIRQAEDASAFSTALDRIIHSGMSVDVLVTAEGELKVLEVGART